MCLPFAATTLDRDGVQPIPHRLLGTDWGTLMIGTAIDARHRAPTSTAE
jgi:hypothetical protein